jgi:hypothetical protein
MLRSWNLVGQGIGAATAEKRTIFLPTDAWLSLLLFMALLLTLSLNGLAASGHFPSEHRAPALQSRAGRLLLFGSIAIATGCFAFALIVAWRQIPWYAAIIGGGSVILIAPLAMHQFPDSFVNGARALIVFGGVSLLLAIAMTWIAVVGLN